MNLLQITTFTPKEEPLLLTMLGVLFAVPGGPGPAVEIFFECLEKSNASDSPPHRDVR